jgi:DNA-binding SARP family transcriptional activator
LSFDADKEASPRHHPSVTLLTPRRAGATLNISGGAENDVDARSQPPPGHDLRLNGSARDARLRLGLLGGFELRSGVRPAPLTPHLERLVAFLALQGRSVHRAYVAGRLWTDHSEENAHGCLRTSLWRIGRLPRPPVEVTTTHVGLAPGVTVDARELESAAERVLYGARPPVEDVGLLVHAADLLPDWYDDWVEQERERLRQLRLLALDAAGEALIEAERFGEAALVALTAVAAEPIRESAYRVLIRAHLGEGNVGEAIRQGVVFRTQLRRELGLDPSPRMEELIRGIGAG